MIETVGFIFIIIGLIFDLFGCIGLVRLPDVYNRLQAATKCVTLGTCFILIGAAVFSGLDSMGIKALIAMGFVLITSPTAAHAIAKGAHSSGVELDESTVVDKYAEAKEEGEES